LFVRTDPVVAPSKVGKWSLGVSTWLHYRAETFIIPAVALLASAAVALPVLVATCAYITGAEFEWGRGLSAPIRSAPRFYLALAVAVAGGVASGVAGAGAALG